ncbi:MAG: NAD(P)/FAD-dependent oxidoreductase, partial [Lachnospiraceae bacterium]|nr:NAD(P)/FAD-dependent oxidoreductase [Lachnospiraceae bacterium]
SAFKGKFCVLERTEDVCTGTSKANSAIIHAGFDAAHGSLMAKYNLIGNRMYPKLAEELDFSYKNNGSLVLALSEEDIPKLEALMENGIKNGVEGLEIVDRDRLKELEPSVGHVPVAALYAPTAGIVCPFGATIAFAENAFMNGVEFRFNSEVKGVVPSADENGAPCWVVQTAEGAVRTRAVINAAGVYSDIIHNMVSADKIKIIPRRGDYLLLDRRTGGYVQHTVFQVPGKFGKGVLVSPTVHGNTIIGPTAEDIDDKEGVDTTSEGFDDLMEKAGLAFDDLPLREVITSFAGLRAHEARHDFILGEVADAPLFFDCAGIESPGLTAAPAIGEETARCVAERLGLEKDPDFVPTRKGFLDPKTLTIEELAALIKEKPEYGRIVCRCEQISEGEILDAIRRPLGAKSLDGVKRRVRAGMGRCQAGFCSPRIMDILAEEWDVDVADITKAGGRSEVIVGLVKDRV